MQTELTKKINKNNIQKNKDKPLENKVESLPNSVISDQKLRNLMTTTSTQNFSSSTKSNYVMATNLDKNKQIMNALPQELINRIRESGKRKCISVIEPIVPNKKLRTARATEPAVTQTKNSFMAPNIVQLDHDYCCLSKTRSKTDKKKDSGFESAEEDERTIIEKQPMVKNADGKLMVSLLKVKK